MLMMKTVKSNYYTYRIFRFTPTLDENKHAALHELFKLQIMRYLGTLNPYHAFVGSSSRRGAPDMDGCDGTQCRA